MWSWLKTHDLPNWIAVAFSSLIWPAAVLLWNRRRVNSAPGLEVALSRGEITIGTNKHPAVALEFINHTGSVVYLSSARVIPNRGFYVSVDASRDSGSGSYHVAFLDPRGTFTIREITLQTNERTRGAVACAFQPFEFYTYRAPW